MPFVFLIHALFCWPLFMQRVAKCHLHHQVISHSAAIKLIAAPATLEKTDTCLSVPGRHSNSLHLNAERSIVTYNSKKDLAVVQTYGMKRDLLLSAQEIRTSTSQEIVRY